MKATTIAIDLVKDTDGSFKILELNTSVGIHPISQSVYSNVDLVTNYASSSNVSEIHYIGGADYGRNSKLSALEVQDEAYPSGSTDAGMPLFQEIKYELSGSSFVTSYQDHKMSPSAAAIPYVADSPSKFIIRNAYDNTALVDTEYAANTINFLKLVSDYCTGSNAVSFPPSYTAPIGSSPSVLDTIDTGSLRDNGIHPNYIIKTSESGVHTDNLTYPKLYHVTSSAALQHLKDGLDEGEILQEYVYNPSDLVEGKIKTYRVIGLLAGSNLDTIHFFDPYYVSNRVAPFSSDLDYSETGSASLPGKLKTYERVAYIQKTQQASVSGLGYHNVSSEMSVIESGSLNMLNPEDLNIGTDLLTIDVPDLDDDIEDTYSYSGSYSANTPLGTFVSASITAGVQGTKIGFETKLDCTNGDVVYANLNTPILTVENGTTTKFIRAGEIESGSKLLSIDPTNANMLEVGVTKASRVVNVGPVAKVDVEDEDTYLMKGSTVSYYLAHNISCLCYRCYGYANSGNPCPSNATQCPYYPGCQNSQPYCSAYLTNYGGYGCADNKE